jgi:hypothetical protein
MGHCRKHPYLPDEGNWKVTLTPSDVLMYTITHKEIVLPIPLDYRNFLE